MLISDDDELKRIGLKVAESALHTSGMHFRMIGPEHQGIKERAVLWCPQTYGEWSAEYLCYWGCLVNKISKWNDILRREANSAIIESAGEQLRIPSHRESVFTVLEQIANDPATDIQQLNHFFIQRLRWLRDEDNLFDHFRLRRLEGHLTRRNLESRFQRYVLDTTWDEWQDYRVEDELRKHTRPKRLVRALAKRVARNDEAFECLLPKLVSSSAETGALFAFGQDLCNADRENKRLLPLLEFKSDSMNSQCVGGYLAGLKECDPSKWSEVLLGLLANEESANRGADLVWHSGFDDQMLIACMNAFEMGWIGSNIFRSLCYGMSCQAVSQNGLVRLFTLLSNREDPISADVLVDLLDRVLKKNAWPVDSDFVFRVVTAGIHFEERLDTMHAYHWNNVCKKLIAHDSTKALLLLDALLQQMGSNYRLSYDRYVEPLAKSLCRMNPTEAWGIVASHLLSSAPEWRIDILNWLKGGFGSFDEKHVVPPIAGFPPQLILNWIEQDPEERATMIADCAPDSLDDEFGGALTRALLANYRNLDGVVSGIHRNFHHSGCRHGPRSQHLRAMRNQFRNWLGKDFDVHVRSWIDEEIVYLDREIEAAEISEEREAWNRP